MSLLTSLTTCTLCGESFPIPPSVHIVGSKTDAKAEAHFKQLASHLNTKHPHAAQAIAIKGTEFMGLLYLMSFKTTDEALIEERDRLRWQIHQQTLKSRWPDENIDHQAFATVRDIFDRLSYAAVDGEEFKATYDVLKRAFTGIRDALEERGKYDSTEKEPVEAHPQVS
jgi:hypothetical protein